VRRSDGRVHISLLGLGQLGQNLTSRGVAAFEPFARFGETPVDIVTERIALIDQPCQRLSRALGGWAIVHGLKNLFHAHDFIFSQILTALTSATGSAE
jgi:hypothetical protein